MSHSDTGARYRCFGPQISIATLVELRAQESGFRDIHTSKVFADNTGTRTASRTKSILNNSFDSFFEAP
jgi:hypothetical protein